MRRPGCLGDTKYWFDVPTDESKVTLQEERTKPTGYVARTFTSRKYALTSLPKRLFDWLPIGKKNTQ